MSETRPDSKEKNTDWFKVLAIGAIALLSFDIFFGDN